jgi:hypothetical protein
MLLTYCFNIGSVEEALKAPVPFGIQLSKLRYAQADLILPVSVFQNAVETPKATTAFTVLVLILLTFITISALAAASRQTFAFA